MNKINQNSPYGDKNAGFTLIELLVVVLIIGVLSAVALPQYTRAVAKSRAVQGIMGLKAITEAQERYYMANGYYTAQLDELDITVPNTRNQGGYEYSCVDGRGSSVTTSCYGSSPKGLYLEFYLLRGPQQPAGKRWCIAYTEQQHDICRSFGELDMGNSIGTGYYLIN